MKRIFLCVLAFVLLSLAVSSAKFTVGVVSLKDVISFEDEASFSLSVRNSGINDDFRVYYSGVEWDIQPVSFSLKQGETKKIVVNARPLYVGPGQYAVPLNIKSSEGSELQKIVLLVNVIENSGLSYIPSVGVSIDAPSEISPENNVEIKMDVRNKNPLDLGALSVSVDSDAFSGSKDFVLGPTTAGNVSEVDIGFVFQVDRSLPPQSLPVAFKILRGNQTIYLHQKSIAVVESAPSFGVEKTAVSSFFKTVETYTIKNVGNVVKKETYRVKIPLFRDIFASESPRAGVLKENGERYFFWEVELEPGKSQELVVSVNYRPFLLFMLIIAIAVALYFVLRSQLSIVKTAEVIMKEEGGISMLKVMLRLKNISEKPVSDVAVYDTIPKLADYVREDSLGSLSPQKVLKHDAKGTLLKWEIPLIEGFEERIITYKIKTQLKVLGGLNLPEASGRFKTGGGRQRFSKSNAFKLIMKQR